MSSDLWFTYIFTSHGLKHLLKLYPKLLDVVDEDTWLCGAKMLIRMPEIKKTNSNHYKKSTKTLYCKLHGIFYPCQIYRP